MLIPVAAAMVIGLATLSTPAAAQKTQQATQPAPAYDPNERICENVELIGSRLAKRRFCGTRAEWEDRKRQDREATERAQNSPCVRDGVVCK